MKKIALIGSTGFVGSTLSSQTSFTHFYHSTDIEKIDGESFDLVVTAGAPAKKWFANQHPEKDENSINSLIAHLSRLKTKKMILISTVDVFRDPVDVDEDTVPDISELHPYGRNRLRLEKFVRESFEDFHIIRLPGLVGRGLRKNIIYDFKHKNNLQAIDTRNVFQFYPMKNLWRDIQKGIHANIPLLHLTSAPVTVSAVAKKGFNFDYENFLNQKLISYDFKTKFASLWGKEEPYQYSVEETLEAVRKFAKEP